MNNINKNWNVVINQDGNLFIEGKSPKSGVVDLFGSKQTKHGICIYAHYLRSVRQILSAMFPTTSISNFEMIEAIIREEFCESRSVNIFKSILDKADIPYRSYTNVA